MILAGDLGGTKTVLALYDAHGHITREQIYQCADYPSLEAILDAFMPEPVAIVGACIGVAGPVVDGVARITNLTWTIDAKALSRKLAAPVTLLNDLQATALGTLALPASAFATLQPQQKPAPTGTLAVIAPGTGLGEALVVHDGTRFVALASEGGHADLAPGSDEEVELWRFLRGRYGNHVSYERVLSGNGLGDLYDFVRARSDGKEPTWLTEELKTGDRNATIAKVALAALSGQDYPFNTVCLRALELFIDVLAAEASNHALRGLATGGVVIGGGIPPKILPALQRPAFLARFNDKGRFSKWTSALGVRVTLEPRAALFGAAHYVQTNKE